MQLKLNLFTRAMILISVPLVCEILFAINLFWMINQLDDTASREHRAREALASLNSIYDRLTGTSELVARTFVQEKDVSVLELHDITAIIPSDLSNLRRQLLDDTESLQAVDRLEQDILDCLSIVDQALSSMKSGNRFGSIQQLRDLRSALPDLTGQLNELRGRTGNTADFNFEKQRKERRQIEVILQCIIVVNVVLAIGLAIITNRSMTGRLSVIVENTRRLATRQELLPPVKGGDEIAELDRVFKEMAEGLAEAERKRSEIERLKQEFVAMISHDLRTPLTSIALFLSMLKKGMLGDLGANVTSRAELAERSASRLISLVNDLLDMEKMESGELVLFFDDTDIAEVLHRAVDSVRGVAEQRGNTIFIDAAAEISVQADGDRLVQVLVNLLGNAIKFSPEGAPVKISARVTQNILRIEVVDNGRGVPEHLRETIFERFKQVSAQDAAEKQGSGLGLAICKAIIEQHGGRIGVDSGLALGSTFWFTLPINKSVPLEKAG